jgi:hypothetical protein
MPVGNDFGEIRIQKVFLRIHRARQRAHADGVVFEQGGAFVDKHRWQQRLVTLQVDDRHMHTLAPNSRAAASIRSSSVAIHTSAALLCMARR